MFVGREGTRRTGHALHQAVQLLNIIAAAEAHGIPIDECIYDTNPDHSQVSAPPV
jgi:hypothetical protein